MRYAKILPKLKWYLNIKCCNYRLFKAHHYRSAPLVYINKIIMLSGTRKNEMSLPVAIQVQKTEHNWHKNWWQAVEAMHIQDHLMMKHSYLSDTQFGFGIYSFFFQRSLFIIVISNHDSSEAVIKNKNKLKNFFPPPQTGLQSMDVLWMWQQKKTWNKTGPQ